MRPVELELLGFSAYRDRQVVDFRDADFFALVGATGSGKSSLIDAICFALYGTVPRYDDRRLVAPVITQGATEARVRFTFGLGPTEYTAVRVVRRTATGASTREARLEAADGTVLAGTADEVATEVERLLGLPFEHFTRCVVLPQGEFARFLHDKPRDRQELLVRLLDLGVYERMRALALERRSRAEGRAAQLQGRLDGELAGATPQAVAEAAERVATLGVLREVVVAAQPGLDQLADQLQAAQAELLAAREALEALRSIGVPTDVDDLAERVRAGERAVVAARAERDAAASILAAHEDARAAHGDLGTTRGLLERQHERTRVRTEVAEATEAGDGAGREAARADTAVEQAVADHDAAVRRRAEAEREHLAHALADQLAVGAPCPVCLVPVASVPDRPDVPTLAEARDAEGRAAHTLAAAREAQRRAQRDQAAAETRRATLAAQLARLDVQLAGAPDPAALEATLAAIATADAAVGGARTAHQRAQAALDAAVAAEGDLAGAVQAARRLFTATRDRVVALGAPAPGGTDLAADWVALAAWADAAALTQEARTATLAQAAAALAEQRRRTVATLEQQVEAAGVPTGRQPLGEAVGTAQARAEAKHHQLEALAAAGVEARAALAAAGTERELAHRLGQHLSAKGFERWLLDEAMGALVAGATTILGTLTDGQYEVALDGQGAFVVIDHHNAGERRLARTLSGGETFLASLALALALADQLAGLASGGASRLEALFLDEGFGTLDADTLDAVATAMEHLGASGRIVGLVTHVRELADRVPVRFEVTKDERTARVARVLA